MVLLQWLTHGTEYVCGAVRFGTYHPSWPIQGAVLDRRPVPPVCLAKNKRANRSNVYPRRKHNGWGMVKECQYAVLLISKMNLFEGGMVLREVLFQDVNPILNPSSTPSLGQERPTQTAESLGPKQILRWASTLNCKGGVLKLFVHWHWSWGVGWKLILVIVRHHPYPVHGNSRSSSLPQPMFAIWLRPAVGWRGSCPSFLPCLWVHALPETQGSQGWGQR